MSKTPKATCSKCGKRIWTRADRERGHCSTCEVASWPKWKRDAIRKVVGRATKGDVDGAHKAVDDYFAQGEEQGHAP